MQQTADATTPSSFAKVPTDHVLSRAPAISDCYSSFAACTCDRSELATQSVNTNGKPTNQTDPHPRKLKGGYYHFFPSPSRRPLGWYRSCSVTAITITFTTIYHLVPFLSTPTQTSRLVHQNGRHLFPVRR